MHQNNLQGAILEMFREIRSYSGGFGDLVTAGLINPFAELMRNDLTDFERLGMSISVLVYLQTHIDNSSYSTALIDDQAINVISLFETGHFTNQTDVVKALGGFFESEEAFTKALQNVYDRVVMSFLDKIDVSQN
ncbi:MAG: hypothetical protein AB8G18_17310 [Gammaproteobacteria bacterium]